MSRDAFSCGGEEGDDLKKELERVFSDLGQKPAIEQAQRLGSAEAQEIRAVRVKLRNRIAALSVVRKALLGQKSSAT